MFEFSVRGALNSMYDPFNNSGIIISYLLGNYLNCVDQAKMQLIPLVIFIVVAFLLPESPEFMVQMDKAEVDSSVLNFNLRIPVENLI